MLEKGDADDALIGCGIQPEKNRVCVWFAGRVQIYWPTTPAAELAL